MQLKRVEITELVGINENAVEGVAQTSPVELKGFNFGRAGGYFVEFAQGSTAVVTGVPAQFVSHDDFGIVLFDNNKVLYENTLSDQSSGSIANFQQYLVPNSSIGTNPTVSGSDNYSLGGFARDLVTNTFRDLPRVSGITLSAAGSGNTIDDTKDHRILVFFGAPTENGFLTYQSFVDDLASGSITSGQAITVTADTVLPRGYEMRAYMSDAFASGANPTRYLPEEPAGNFAYSDGGNAMSVTFTTDSSSGSTTAALLSFDSENGVIEPHLRRVWGKAKIDSLVGPYVPTAIAESVIYGSDTPPFARSENSGSAFDTAFNGSQEFYVRADLATYPFSVPGLPGNLYWFQQIYVPANHGSATNEFYFYYARRYTDAGVVQFGAGVRVRIVLPGSGTRPRPITIQQDPFIEYNGNKNVLSVSPLGQYTLNASSTSSLTVNGHDYYPYYLYLDAWMPRAEFKVDLGGSAPATGSWTFNHKDLNDSVIYSNSVFGFPATTLTNVGVTATPIDVMAININSTSVKFFPFGPGATPGINDVWAYLNTGGSAYDIEVHDNSLGTSPIAIIDADDWNGATALITDSVTGVTWENYDEYNDVSSSMAASSGSEGQKYIVRNAAPSFSILNPRATLLYSAQGHINYADNYTNFLEFRFLTSNEITAVVSTPAGLLVFGENETFLVRGDPALVSLGGEFTNQRLSGVIGCDPGRRPARLGGAVFVIHQGRLYGVNLGAGDVDFGSNLTDIGQPVYEPEDPFVQVIGDPVHRQIVAHTQVGRVLRFSTVYNQWLNDVFDGTQIDFLYPSVNEHSSRYVIDGSAYEHVDFPTTASVKWENLDLGDKGMKKMWRRVRVFTSDDYSGTPSLNYVINGSSGTVTATEEGSGWWVFTLPSGIVSEKAESLEVVMNGAAFGDQFEPPVIVEYVDRYSRR